MCICEEQIAQKMAWGRQLQKWFICLVIGNKQAFVEHIKVRQYNNINMNITVASHGRHGVSNQRQLQTENHSTLFALYLRNDWWRHQMKALSALLAICAGNSPVSGDFPAQRPVARSFDLFFDRAGINGLINNREAGDLRRHRPNYNVIVMISVHGGFPSHRDSYAKMLHAMMSSCQNAPRNYVTWHKVISLLTWINNHAYYKVWIKILIHSLISTVQLSWTRNYNHGFLLSVITHTYPNFDEGRRFA